MARLDVVVADGDGIIPHIGHQLDKKVFTLRFDVIVIIGSVVSLQAVARVEQQDVLLSDRPAKAVHPGVYGHQAGLLRLAFHVRFVEPAAVDVARGDDMQRAFAWGTCGDKQDEKENYGSNMWFHDSQK